MFFLCFTMFIIVCQSASHIAKFFLTYVFHKRDRERKLKMELKEITEQLQQISITDEFARYARIKRKVIKLQDDYRIAAQEASTLYVLIDTILGRVVGDIFCNFVCFLVITLSSAVLLEINPKWMFPLHGFIAWPNSAGTLGLLPWFLIVKNTIKAFKQVI